MAIIVFRCPSCGKKVETSEDNVGREGLCPGCQKVFEIPEPSKRDAARAARASTAIGLSAGGPPEYAEAAVLIGAAVVAVGLVALLAATFLGWVQPAAGVAQVVDKEKGYVLVGTAVSLVFLVISAVTRRSLMPPVLAGAAWGMFALIWTGSIWRTVGAAVPENASSPLTVGIFLAMGACVVVLFGAMFVYYQVRDGAVLEKFGFFLLVTQVVALFGALLLASHSLRPELRAAPPAQAQTAKTPNRPAPPPAPRPNPQAPPAAEGAPAPGAE